MAKWRISSLGTLTPSGKIIGIPFGAETVLEIDPVTKTTNQFGVISSTLRRKWLGGVLGDNGKVYAIPYDADAVLEIDPDSHTLSLFGNLGSAPCKWYGARCDLMCRSSPPAALCHPAPCHPRSTDGAKAPNGRIYAIPYAADFVLEIDPALRSALPFALVDAGWGKWAGGVLAPNGRIYGIPALATSILEIDPQAAAVRTFGMLPGDGTVLTDKWNGGVVAPNGKLYGIPWRSASVLEFDPETHSISLLGRLAVTNFTWHGGVLASDGRIIALPYNSRRAPHPPASAARVLAL